MLVKVDRGPKIRASGDDYTQNAEPCHRCMTHILKAHPNKAMDWASPQHVLSDRLRACRRK